MNTFQVQKEIKMWKDRATGLNKLINVKLSPEIDKLSVNNNSLRSFLEKLLAFSKCECAVPVGKRCIHEETKEFMDREVPITARIARQFELLDHAVHDLLNEGVKNPDQTAGDWVKRVHPIMNQIDIMRKILSGQARVIPMKAMKDLPPEVQKQLRAQMGRPKEETPPEKTE